MKNLLMKILKRFWNFIRGLLNWMELMLSIIIIEYKLKLIKGSMKR